MLSRRTLIAGALTAAITLGGAATAAADSLVFTKDSNVWLADTDGTGLHQVTTDGTPENPWLAPSQAETGRSSRPAGSRPVGSSTGSSRTAI